MKFCVNCKNMLYITVEGDKTLKYVCKNCNYAEMDENPTEAICVLESNFEDDENDYKQYMTPYIKYDPTLPRVSNIQCTNAKCNKPANVENEVIYIKYNHMKMKYLYHCCHCNSFWKSSTARKIESS
jgi:DNA-directed RNA polymerase subunit M/transcription elongation factor TFIIS